MSVIAVPFSVGGPPIVTRKQPDRTLLIPIGDHLPDRSPPATAGELHSCHSPVNLLPGEAAPPPGVSSFRPAGDAALIHSLFHHRRG